MIIKIINYRVITYRQRRWDCSHHHKYPQTNISHEGNINLKKKISKMDVENAM